MIWSRIFVSLLLVFLSSNSFAAPPASCAGKFVGTWQHSWTNVETFTRDGQAICSGNPFCQQGTWTCNGNGLIYTNSSGTFTYELQPNGTAVHDSLNYLTRTGAGNEAATANSAKSSTDQGPATARKKLPPNCIDATGLPGYKPGSMRCEDRTDNEYILSEARSFMTLARAAARYRDYADLTQAANQYTNAAEAFTKAGRPAEARQASLLAQQASADADRYQQRTERQQLQQPSSSNSGSLRDRIISERRKNNEKYCHDLTEELAQKGLQGDMLIKAVKSSKRCRG